MPLLRSSRKISAGSDTACGSGPYLCNEQSAASGSLLEQGLRRGLCRLRCSLHSPQGEALPGQSGFNGALSAGKCPVYQVNAAW